MNANRPHKVIVYVPTGAPLVFEGERFIGMGNDSALGVGPIVLDDDGNRMTIFGLPFALVQRESSIQAPPPGRIVRG